MDEKKIFEISENTRKNSIGQDKVCLYQPKTKKVVLRTKLALLVTVFIFSNMAGCNTLNNSTTKNNNEIVNEENKEDKYNGYDLFDIALFEKQRAINLLEKYNLTDYTMDGTRRNYNYTIDDYKKIVELDETYMRAFYTTVVEEDFIILLNTLGYSNLNDFLLKNGYMNAAGKPSTAIWTDADVIYISNIMKEAEMSLKGGIINGK